MKNKKVIFAIVLFLLIGLTVFTFANTDEQNFKDSSKEVKENSGSKTDSEETTNNDKSVTTTNDNTTTLTTDNSTNNTNQTTRQNTATVNANNTQNDAAKSAVEKAESTLTQTDVNNAQTLVGNLTDTNVKEDLENRLEEVQNTIDVTLLVDNLEKQVNDATMLSNIVDARDYRSSSKVVEKVNALNNTTKKEELTNRLNTLSSILDDEDVPSVTGIDTEFTNQNVTLTITDANTFTAMLNGKSYVSGSVIEDEGEYTLTVIDEAFNESKPLTFTIDKTDPVFDGLKSGGHYDEITINVVDENIKTITVKNMDKNVTEEVQNGTKLTDDATYYITAIDKAGNNKSIFVAIDKKDPSIERKIGGEFVNQNEIVTISDKFLMTVDIDGTVYTRDNFTVGANNENFTLEKEISEEGTHTITATDKMGNTITETFTIDKTKAKASATNILVLGDSNDLRTYYAKKGDKINLYVRFNEELLENPTFTLINNGKEYNVADVTKTEKNGEYQYSVTYEIDENTQMTNGELTFKVSNIKDLAGNVTEDITKASNGHRVFIDIESPSANPLYILNISDANNRKLIKDGQTIRVEANFNEELLVNPVLNIGDQKQEFRFRGANNGVYTYVADLAIDNTKAKLENDKEIPFTITNIKDLAENETTLDNTNVTNYKDVYGQVVYDNEAPVYDTLRLLRITPSYSSYVKNGETIRVIVHFNEELATLPNLSINDTINQKFRFDSERDGKYIYMADYTIKADEISLLEGELQIKVSDYADTIGNVGEVLTNNHINHSTQNMIVYDRTNPEIKFNANGASAGSNYAYKNVTVTVTIKDATLKEVYYVWDKKDNKLDENTFKNATKLDVSELTDNGDGTYSFNTTIDSDTAGYRLKVKAIDKAGNISQEKTNRFIIDNTIPTAEIEYSTKDSTKDNVTVKLVNASEEITIINNDGKDTYTFTDNGEFTFEFKDKAGNIGTAKAIVANIDRILPVITVNSNGASAGTNYAYKQIKLTINITEENLKEIYYVWSTNNNLDENTFNNATKVDVSELTKNEDGTYSLTVEKSNENTGYRLKVKAVDMALNEQTLKTNRYILDNTAPIFNNAQATMESPVKIDVTEPNLDKIVVNNKTTSETYEVENGYVLTEDGFYKIIAYDKAGNVSVTWNLTIDNNPPAITIENATANNYYNTDVVVNINDIELQQTYLNDVRQGRATTLTITEEGTYTVKAVDRFGHESNITFVIDKNSPNLAVDTIENGVSNTKDPQIHATDANPFKTIIKLNGEVVRTDVANQGSDGTYWTWFGIGYMQDGDYEVTSIDEAGNSKTYSFTLSRTTSAAYFTTSEENDELTITGYDANQLANNTRVEIPLTINGKPVTGIADNAFAGTYDSINPIEVLVIPEIPRGQKFTFSYQAFTYSNLKYIEYKGSKADFYKDINDEKVINITGASITAIYSPLFTWAWQDATAYIKCNDGAIIHSGSSWVDYTPE